MTTLSTNEIPPITDPLGQYWEQPDRQEILIDSTHAVMTDKTFLRLHNYSTTDPTGVYEGKMWRSQEIVRDGDRLIFSDRWLLRWFGFSGDPAKCSYNQRLILLV